MLPATAEIHPHLAGVNVKPCSSTPFSVGAHNQVQRAVCSPQVLTTIAEVRTPSTTHLYAYKWKVFESWCS